MFFGWGTKTKIWELGNGYKLMCVYKYFHIWFLLRFITSKRWILQGNVRSDDRELTREEVHELIPGWKPKLSAYGYANDSPTFQQSIESPDPYNELVASLNAIKHTDAHEEHKISLSRKLIEGSSVPSSDKEALKRQLKEEYK